MRIQHDGPLRISVGTSRDTTYWEPEDITWRELLDRLSTTTYTQETVAEYHAMSREKQVAAKDVGGFVGGVLRDGKRKREHVQERQLLALDADYGTLDLWDDWLMLYGQAACVYSTHSHRAEKPRLRLLFPLSRPVTPEEYEAVARKVASWLGMDAFDDTTYEANRLMFWSSTPKDGAYIFEYADGPWVDPDAALAEYEDWRDRSGWPVSEKTRLQRHRAADRQGDPREKPGLVGAFCRAYDVPAAIAAFLPEVYAPFQEGRYSYTGGTTCGGLVIYDGGDFAYSHHNTDPVGGRLCNAFDLVRLHRFGPLDAGKEDLQVHELPSYGEMKALCNGYPAVIGELEARIRETAREDFGDVDDTLGRYERDFTEQGNAVKFADVYGNVLRYQRHLGWLFWDGMRWLKDAKGEALMLAMRFADNLLEEALAQFQKAADKREKERAQAAIAWANKSRSNSKMENMLRLVAPMVDEKDVETFDPDPWMLNTPAGIVDLRTGGIGPHDPEQRCTALCAAPPEPWNPEKGKMWQASLDRMTNGSEGFQRYLQVLGGMSLVGEVYEEGMAIPYGPGGNGKSTVFGAMGAVMGDYAGSIRPELLMAKSNGQEAFGLEQVYHKRLVVAAETDEGARLSVSVMKRLSSRDPINANPKRRDPFTFKPTHTLIMHTNHLPRLRSLDEGTKRRLAIVPFENVIPGNEMVTDYGKLLLEQEGGLILGWMIAGARLFWEAGKKLAKPQEVLEATQEYFQGEDWMNSFLEEQCEIGEKLQEKAGELYAAYQAWAERNGQHPRRGNDFAKELEKKGFEKQKGKKGAMWYGLQVKEGELLDDG